MAKLLRGLPFCPLTFVLPEEWPVLAADCDDHPEAIWISKPCQLGEGRHIKVLQSKDLRKEGEAMGACIVSRYIKDPLLVEGRKADLRVYALVTRLQPLESFVFRDGLVRICGASYDTSNFHDLAAHVSNNSVQTKSSRHASGRNLSLQELWQGWDECISRQTLWRRIVRVVRDSLYVWQPTAVAAARGRQMEDVTWRDVKQVFRSLASYLLMNMCSLILLYSCPRFDAEGSAAVRPDDMKASANHTVTFLQFAEQLRLQLVGLRSPGGCNWVGLDS